MTERRPRGRQPDPAVTLARLDGGDLPVRGELVIGMVALAGRMVVVSMAAQDLSVEQRVAQVKPVSYILAHVFTTDLAQSCLQVLSLGAHDNVKPTYAGLIHSDDGPVLNTFIERSTYITEPQTVLAKLVAIRPEGPVLVGDAPLPPLIEYTHTRSYPWRDSVLRMASDFVMECVGPDDAQRWRRRTRAHLYTPIEFRGDRAYFGTAGNGGFFHCMDPATGEDHYCVQTGDTVLYDWWGANRIVLTDQRKPAVVVIDAHSGAELARVSLGRYVVYGDAPRLLLDGVFFTRAFGPAPDSFQYIVRVDLNAALGDKGENCS